jgi:hypothetical protein
MPIIATGFARPGFGAGQGAGKSVVRPSFSALRDRSPTACTA